MTPRRLTPGFIVLSVILVALVAVVLADSDGEGPAAPEQVSESGSPGPLIDPDARGPFPFTPGLYVMDTETGDIRRVLDQKGDDSFGMRPSYQWSEDGEWLVAASIGNRDRIVAVSRDGSVRREAQGQAWSVTRLDGGDFVLHMRRPSVTGEEQPEILGRLDLSSMAVDEVLRASGERVISPDGKYIIKTVGESTSPNFGSIELTDIASGATKVLLAPVNRNQTFWLNAESAWSPDSTRVLAYTSTNEGQYVVMDVNQVSDTFRFSADARPAAWSPDGGSIAHTMWEEVFSLHPADGALHIWDIKTRTSRSFGRGTSPSWSPDGSSLAFVRAGEIWRVDLGSGSEERLVQVQLPVLDEPRWSPDGRYIAFRSRGGGSEILRINADGSNEQYIGLGWEAEISPDGNRIAFLNGFGGLGFAGNLYTMDLDGEEIRRVGSVWFGDTLPNCPGRRFSWSPDGRSLAYNRDMNAIEVAAADGTGLPVSLGEGTGPFWSRDSARVLYARRIPGGRPACGIFARPAPGGAEIQIAGGVRSAEFSPDGRYLLAELDLPQGPHTVAVMEAGNASRLSEVANAWNPSWSTDSTRVAYVRVEGGRGAFFPPFGMPGVIVVAPASDLSTPSLTIPVATVPNHLAWSPDGQRLAYSMSSDQGTFIYVVRLDDPTSPVRLTEGTDPGWSADGKTIVFTRYYSE